jgi:peptidoglycan/xylan/chitin deacetylase (PgdA/CDA1 family)
LAGSTTASALRRAALLGLCFVALTIPAADAGAQTVVSLTFDDGNASHYEIARPQLIAHGMLATFYVNSGKIGTGPAYLSWPQLDRLNADGHEIAGHTIDHALLSPGAISASEARRQICDDGAALRGRGYHVVDFAYPYGLGATNPVVQAALHECGFVSARMYGGLRGPDCPGVGCPPAERIPPADPYAVNSTGNTGGPLTLAQLRSWVRQAENSGGGWVPIVLHLLDDSGQNFTVTPSTFAAFLDWLQARESRGTVVRTVRSVMLGFPDPEPPSSPVPLAASTFWKATDTATAFASLRARKLQRIGRLYVSAAMDEPGTISAGGAVSLASASRTHRFKTASAKAVPGVLVRLRLRLSKRGLRAARKHLRRHRKLKARLTITARDQAGNTTTAKRTVRLRR